MSENGRDKGCLLGEYCPISDSWQEFERDARHILNDFAGIECKIKHLDELPLIRNVLQEVRDGLASAASEPARGVPRIVVTFGAFLFTIIIVVLILKDTPTSTTIGPRGFTMEHRDGNR